MAREPNSGGSRSPNSKPIDTPETSRRTKEPQAWRRAGLFGKLIGLAVAIGLFCIAALLVVFLAPPFEGLRRDFVVRVLEFQVGRDIRFEGDLKISIARDIRVAFTDLVVKNPDWASKPDMVRVDKGEIALRLWPLLTGALVVPNFLVDGAVFNFEISADGRKSWLDTADQGADGEAGRAEDRHARPRAGQRAEAPNELPEDLERTRELGQTASGTFEEDLLTVVSRLVEPIGKGLAFVHSRSTPREPDAAGAAPRGRLRARLYRTAGLPWNGPPTQER